jgi:hypothetical protein
MTLIFKTFKKPFPRFKQKVKFRKTKQKTPNKNNKIVNTTSIIEEHIQPSHCKPN